MILEVIFSNKDNSIPRYRNMECVDDGLGSTWRIFFRKWSQTFVHGAFEWICYLRFDDNLWDREGLRMPSNIGFSEELGAPKFDGWPGAFQLPRHRFWRNHGIFWSSVAFLNGEHDDKAYDLRFPVLRQGSTGVGQHQWCAMLNGILIRKLDQVGERHEKEGACLVVFNKWVETRGSLLWIGDETSTTSYSDVQPGETIVVSSRRCDGCDKESRRDTWGLMPLNLGTANSPRSQEISSAQIKNEQVLPVSWSGSSQSHLRVKTCCRSWQLDGWKSTALDRPPESWEFGWVNCLGTPQGFGFLWWTYSLGASRAPIPRHPTRWQLPKPWGHISNWKYHC